MREHMGLFRGKRIDNGEWVEGAYCKHDAVKVCFTTDDPKTKHLIVVDGFCDWGFEPALVGHEVDPDTVGECTGLRDKNGKLIFEGDVFEWGYAGVKEFRYVVAYDAKLASFVGERHFGFVSLNGIDIEIIGNVHDNPELIGGEGDG